MKKQLPVLLLLLAMCLFSNSSFSQIVEFGDPKFKEYMLFLGIDLNGDGEIQVDEAEAYDRMIHINAPYTSLKGIEAFTSIQMLEFHFFNGSIEELSLVGMTKLQSVHFIPETLIENIYIKDCPLLGAIELYGMGKPMSSLHIENCPEMTNIRVESYGLTSENLVIKDVPKLSSLILSRNNLTTIDLSEIANVETLYLEYNPVGNIDLTSLDKLGKLSLKGCGVTEFDMSLYTDLWYLDLAYNELTTLDMTPAVNLVNFGCAGNKLTSLLIENSPNLETVDCGANQLTEVRLKSDVPLTRVITAENPDLGCISTNDTEIDNPSDFVPEGYVVDKHTVVNFDCDLYKEVYIPDENFKAALVTNPDINTYDDERIFVMEAEAVTGEIDVHSLGIESLTGIEAFTNLTSLLAHDNLLTEVDLSQNTKLRKLILWVNQLTSLDVSALTELTDLNAGVNALTELDLSKNTILDTVLFNGNNITNIDLSNNSKISYLEFQETKISSIDLSLQKDLEILKCYNAGLTELDLSNKPDLRYVTCAENKFMVLNLKGSNNPDMELYAVDHSIYCVEVDDVAFAEENWNYNFGPNAIFTTECQADKTVNIPDDAFRQEVLMHYDLNQDGEVQYFEAWQVMDLMLIGRGITDMTGIEAFVNLMALVIPDNNISELDLRQNTQLQKLDYMGNEQLSCISVNNPEEAYAMWDYGNPDVVFSSDCQLLKNVYIPDANLKKALVDDPEINTNKDAEIQYGEAAAYTGKLEVYSQGIDDMTGIEAFVNITGLICDGNDITDLDISANTKLTDLKCNDNGLTRIDVTNNPMLQYLDASNNDLTEINLSENKQLTWLDLGSNMLAEINLSACGILKNLELNDNDLSNLDLSANSSVETLSIRDNSISQINVSALKDLQYFYCSNNKLTELELTNHVVLTELHCEENVLTKLNLKGEKGMLGVSFTLFATNNPDLTCILADSDDYTEMHWDEPQIDATASIVTECVTLEPIEVSVTETACGGYEFDGEVLTKSGDYTATFVAKSGVDSIVNLSLTIYPVYNNTEEVTIPFGSVYTFGEEELTITGEYEKMFKSTNGCDSVVYLILTVLDETDVLIEELTINDSEMEMSLGKTSLAPPVLIYPLGATYGEYEWKLVDETNTALTISKDDAGVYSFTATDDIAAAGTDVMVKAVALDGSGVESEPFKISLKKLDENDVLIEKLVVETTEMDITVASSIPAPDVTVYPENVTFAKYEWVLVESAATVVTISKDDAGVYYFDAADGISAHGHEVKVQAVALDGSGVKSDIVTLYFKDIPVVDFIVSTTQSLDGEVGETLDIELGDELKLYAVGIQPDDASDKSVTITSDNEEIVYVDAQTGKIIPVLEGQATLSVTVGDVVKNILVAVVKSATVDYSKLEELVIVLEQLYSENPDNDELYSLLEETEGLLEQAKLGNATQAEIDAQVQKVIEFDDPGNTTGTQVSEEVCGSYDFNGEELTESGTYTRTFKAVDDSDSVVTLTLIVNPTYNIYFDKVIKEGSKYPFGDKELTEAGDYMITYTSVAGCDSTVNLALEVVPENAIVTELDITACGEYVFDGKVLKESGEYSATFLARSSEDSTVILTLTINPVFETTDEVEVEYGEPYTFGTQTLNETGEYTETFQTVNGCDSVVALRFTVLPQPAITTELVETACESFEFDGQTLTESGEYTATYNSVSGADSIVTLTLTINPAYAITTTKTVLFGETYTFGTQELSASGEYTESFTALTGCDSTVTLTFTVLPEDSKLTELTEVACGSFVYNDETIEESGSYSYTYTAKSGADSVVVLNLTINPIYNTTAELTIAKGQSYEFGTQTLTEAGEYTETFQSVAGCDSTVTLTLIVTDNSAPEIVMAATTFAIKENYPNGNLIATVTASDAEGAELTFSIKDGSDIFAIDSKSGEITVLDSTYLDYETTTSFSFIVEVSDGEAVSEVEITVDLIDVVVIGTDKVAIPFSVYPTMVTNSIVVEAPVNNATVLIYSATGELVSETEFSNKQSIDLSFLRKGTYYINITDGTNDYETNVIIKK